MCLHPKFGNCRKFPSPSPLYAFETAIIVFFHFRLKKQLEGGGREGEEEGGGVGKGTANLYVYIPQVW